VEDGPERDHVGAGERVGEEVADGECDAVLECERADVALERRSGGREIKADTAQVLVGERELHEQADLGAPEVDHGPVALEWEALSDRYRRPGPEAGHRV
jgi:hypothetical protein